MQSFIDRSSIFNVKKKPGMNREDLAMGIKSITTPNSPRRSSSKPNTNQNNSADSQLDNLDNIRTDAIVLNDNKANVNSKHKIILPKGIIHFHGSQTRANSGGSKSAERKTRKVGLSHEPREESLRRKVKVMQIIKNFESDKDPLGREIKAQSQH